MPVITQTARLAPHGLLVMVSGTFSGVFFWNLGSTLFESSVYLALAVGLELAKVYFLWNRSAQWTQRVFTAAMVVVLALFSIMASVSFSVGSLAEEGTRHAHAGEKADDYTLLIEQTSEEIALLQEKLAELPKEWRLTKNEYVEQLAALREEYERLVSARAQARTTEAEVMEARAGFWLIASQALGVEQNKLLLAMMVVLAVILELAIAGTRTREPWSRKPSTAVKGIAEHRPPAVTLREYMETTLRPEAGAQAVSLREAARELGISLYQARRYHQKLKELGVLATLGTRTYQLLAGSQAWKRMMTRDGNVGA